MRNIDLTKMKSFELIFGVVMLFIISVKVSSFASSSHCQILEQ